MIKEFFTSADVAARYRVQPATVRKWVQRRRINPIRVAGRHLFTNEILTAFEQRNETKG